eukprot:s1509_g10.t1
MTYSSEQYKAVGQSARKELGDELRAPLVRFSESIGDIPQTHPHASALSNIRTAAENAKTQGSISAERCFHLHVAEEGVEKWIFHAPVQAHCNTAVYSPAKPFRTCEALATTP